MSRFIMPRQGVKGQNLNPADGAMLFFYTVGTTAFKDTFTDAAKSIASTNPVIADGTGLFAYIEIDGSYDVVLKDKNGVQLWGPETIQELVDDTGVTATQELTTATMAANTNRTYSVGDIVTTKEFSSDDGDPGGATYDTVLTSSVTPNTFDIITSSSDILKSFVLRKSVVSVKQFGATGDGTTSDSAAIQACFDYAKQAGSAVIMPAGDYSVTASLLWDTTGDGNGAKGLVLLGEGAKNVNIINNIAAGGAAIELTSGSSSSDFMYYGMIEGVGITEATSGAGSHGISYRGCWHQVFSRITATDLTGAGIRAINSAADGDSSAHVTIDTFRATGCQSPGFDSTGGTGGVALHLLSQCYFVNNSDAMVALDGAGGITIFKCTMAGGSASPNYDTTLHGIKIKKTTVTCKNIRIVDGEYGNSLEKAIDVVAVNGLLIDGIRFVKRAGETSYTHGIVLGDGPSNTIDGVTIKRLNIQLDHATPVFTVLTVGTAVSRDFRFEPGSNPSFFSGNIYVTLNTGAENFGGYIEDIEGSVMLSKKLRRLRTTVGAGTTLVPNLLDGNWNQYNITAEGDYIIDGPLNGSSDGAEMTISIINNAPNVLTGGGARVQFTSDYQTSGYIDPINENTAQFRFDSTSVKWKQMGSWSTSSRGQHLAVGNVGTGEDDLSSYIIPANTIKKGTKFRVVVWGLTSNNSNVKTIKFYFGSTLKLTTALTTSQENIWKIESDIYCVSTTSQNIITTLTQGGTATQVDAETGFLTETTTASIIIKCTGEATSSNDITCRGMIVEIVD